VIPSGPIVFRVRATRAQSGAVAGAVIGAVLGKLAGIAPQWIVAMCAAGIASGLLIGRTVRSDYCSDPACAKFLGAEDTTCPKCGRPIAGTIDDPKDRLRAEEELRKRR
jgi:hypothetical protein